MTDQEIQLRIDLINGNFVLPDETTEYMRLVRAETAKLATLLNEKRPADYNVGRFIASLDLLQQFKDTLCAAVINGAEGKRRRTADSVAKKAAEEVAAAPTSVVTKE